MIELIRTNSKNDDFRKLVKELDQYLHIKDGDQHQFYAQYNKIDLLHNVLVLYKNNEAIACGAIKHFDSENMEVKRMYVMPNARGNGYATMILESLENWAIELGYVKCILETGKEMKDAIHLYTKSGYNIINNYGQYATIENSICFQKKI